MGKILASLSIFLVLVVLFFPYQAGDGTHLYISFLALVFLIIAFFKVKRISLSIIDYFWFLFLVSCTVSFIFSQNQPKSIFFLTSYTATYIIYKAFGIFLADFDKKIKFWEVFLYCTLILSAVSLFTTIFLRYFNFEIVGISFYWVYFGHNHIANLLLIAIPIASGLIFLPNRKKNQKILLLIMIAIFILTLLLSFSNGALIISLLLATSWLTIYIYKNKLKMNRQLGIILIILLVIGTGLAFNNRYAKELGIKKSPNIFSGRDIYWDKAVKNFILNPYYGTGLGTFKAEGKYKKIAGADYAHNFFLEMLSGSGILGFISGILLILGALIKAGYRILNISVNKPLYLGLFTAAIGSFAYAMVDFAWFIPSVFLLFWLIIASIESAHCK